MILTTLFHLLKPQKSLKTGRNLDTLRRISSTPIYSNPIWLLPKTMTLMIILTPPQICSTKMCLEQINQWLKPTTSKRRRHLTLASTLIKWWTRTRIQLSWKKLVISIRWHSRKMSIRQSNKLLKCLLKRSWSKRSRRLWKCQSR